MNLFNIVHTDKSVRLRPAPINPDWVEAGDPKASNAVLSTSDDGATCAILWECTAGRFTWRYAFDESIYFLEGSVVISAPGMTARRFGPGNSIHFPKGSAATWVIEDRIRKVAFCRSVLPRPALRALRAARSILRWLRSFSAASAQAPSLMES